MTIEFFEKMCDIDSDKTYVSKAKLNGTELPLYAVEEKINICNEKEYKYYSYNQRTNNYSMRSLLWDEEVRPMTEKELTNYRTEEKEKRAAQAKRRELKAEYKKRQEIGQSVSVRNIMSTLKENDYCFSNKYFGFRVQQVQKKLQFTKRTSLTLPQTPTKFL